jgi:hypothetical protein
VTAIDQAWNDYPHWYCAHGYLIGMGCLDCDTDEDDTCDC